jgi:hypothetical protein
MALFQNEWVACVVASLRWNAGVGRMNGSIHVFTASTKDHQAKSIHLRDPPSQKGLVTIALHPKLSHKLPTHSGEEPIKYMPQEDFDQTMRFCHRHGYEYRTFDHDALATLV